ncbi:MAG TPA: hypothetical protein VGF63_06300 [Solirubrobacteraceae bacterium]|jgi:hypothetical protein
MFAIRARRPLLASLVAIVALALGGGVAAGVTTKAKPKPKITAAGVGLVNIGATYSELRAAHLIGATSAGCQLAGPTARSAKLLAPVRGTASLTLTAPRKIQTITVRGGATAHGVAIGAPLAKVTKAFPKAVADHSTDAMFGVTLLKVPQNGGGKLQFAVSTKTGKVTIIGIPSIALCD